MSEERYTELRGEAQQSRREWLKECRAHLAEEHKRWSEGLFKTLTLANTGGIAIVATLISSVEEFRDSVCLRLTLTAFAVGTALSLNSLRHELFDAKKRLLYWDARQTEYLNGTITLGTLFEPLRKHGELRTMDYVVVWLPAAAFLIGLVCSIVFLWFQRSAMERMLELPGLSSCA